MVECPVCGEPDPMFMPGDIVDEPDIYQCPECTWEAFA